MKIVTRFLASVVFFAISGLTAAQAQTPAPPDQATLAQLCVIHVYALHKKQADAPLPKSCSDVGVQDASIKSSRIIGSWNDYVAVVEDQDGLKTVAFSIGGGVARVSSDDKSVAAAKPRLTVGANRCATWIERIFYGDMCCYGTLCCVWNEGGGPPECHNH